MHQTQNSCTCTSRKNNIVAQEAELFSQKIDIELLKQVLVNKKLELRTSIREEQV